MKSKVNTILSVCFIIIGFITLLNLATIFAFPLSAPLVFFSSVHLGMHALLSGQYWMIIPSVGCCVLLFVGAVSIRKGRIIVPILLTCCYLFDIGLLIFLFVKAIAEGYDWSLPFTLNLMPDLVILSMLGIYCRNYCQERQNR